jgi:hypothetical protein
MTKAKQEMVQATDKHNKDLGSWQWSVESEMCTLHDGSGREIAHALRSGLRTWEGVKPDGEAASPHSHCHNLDELLTDIEHETGAV